MPTCFDIANYFLERAYDAQDGITPLKMQKLLYYAQGVHLSFLGMPAFSNRIEAWNHGPVVPDAYHTYKINGSNPIPVDPAFDMETLSKDTRDVLDEVHTVFGQFSAWRLVQMTHDEPPWKNTPNGGEITLKELKAYFDTIVTNDD